MRLVIYEMFQFRVDSCVDFKIYLSKTLLTPSYVLLHMSRGGVDAIPRCRYNKRGCGDNEGILKDHYRLPIISLIKICTCDKEREIKVVHDALCLIKYVFTIITVSIKLCDSSIMDYDAGVLDKRIASHFCCSWIKLLSNPEKG